MRKISFYTLGCKVNQYETQALKEIFQNNGYEVVGENEFAHVYVVNSCSVTGISDRKTRQFIRRTKKLNPSAVTLVTGCYAETGTESVSKIDEVDIILGTAEKSKVYEEVNRFIAENNKIIRTGGVKTLKSYDDFAVVSGMDSRTRAYIKIEDGCDRYCSYCIIPFARGKVRSRSKTGILNEAETLIKKGYKEIILTGINAALYGTDLQKGNDLISLLKSISSLEGDFRIRLSSLEPTVINAKYAKKIIEIDKLCPHLHLSLQSGSNNILSAMKRRYTKDEYLDILRVLKDKDPDYSITTDIIVGFPGESESDFCDSISMVKKAGFSKVHVFKYSKRNGTSASDMPNQIPEKIKSERSKKLMEISHKISLDFLEQNRGKIKQVLVQEYDENKKLYTGISDNNIEVHIKNDEDILNTFVDYEL